MQAARLRSEDGPDALEIVDVPEPRPRDGQVLINVHAAGVSFVDLLMSRGRYQVRPESPFIPGVEISGVVRSAPAGTFTPGDRVAASLLQGGYAEVAAAPATTTFLLPDGVDHRAGTALALNYQTVHFALLRRGRLARGEDVLIFGASGGVGTVAVQLARAVGARVFGVVRTADKVDTALAAGADAASASDSGWVDEARAFAPAGFALVLDPVGGPVFDDGLRLLRPEGRYVVAGFAGAGIPTVKAHRLLLRNLDLVGAGWGAFLSADPGIVAAAVADLGAWIASGAIAPPIGRCFPLAAAADALRALESHAAVGKLVLDVVPCG